MKKLMLTAITIISMACATYANIGNATPPNTNDNITSIQNAGPHTKQYRDIKEVLDRYERDIKGATSCEDLGEAEDSFYSSLLIMQFDDEYDYEESDLMTDEESLELEEQSNRIDALMAQKMEQFGCKSDLGDEYSLIPTTTEEWDEIITEYEAFVSQLEKLSKKKLSSEQYLEEFLVLVQNNMELIGRIENSDPSNITERQNDRLMELNDRIEELATQMGLMGDEEEE